MIAGQKQMRAVVDHHAGDVVVIGAATAARLSRRFMHDDAAALRRQAHGGSETGEAGADDVNGAGVR